MNGFIKKSIGTLTLGEKLKKLRSERRISLGEVSKHTRIQIKYLEYLKTASTKITGGCLRQGIPQKLRDFLAIDQMFCQFLRKREKKNLKWKRWRGKTCDPNFF
jgi:hypothetical protein